MFKLSEIYKLYCEERETLERYEKFDKEHHAHKLGDKVLKYIYKYNTSDVTKLARIRKVRKDLGSNFEEELIIGMEDFSIRELLLHVHVDCLMVLDDLSTLLLEIGDHITTSTVEEIIANTYMLRSIANIVDDKLYYYEPSGYSYNRSNFIHVFKLNLEELLKQVSDKTLEEVVQVYCSNW